MSVLVWETVGFWISILKYQSLRLWFVEKQKSAYTNLPNSVGVNPDNYHIRIQHASFWRKPYSCPTFGLHIDPESDRFIVVFPLNSKFSTIVQCRLMQIRPWHIILGKNWLDIFLGALEFCLPFSPIPSGWTFWQLVHVHRQLELGTGKRQSKPNESWKTFWPVTVENSPVELLLSKTFVCLYSGSNVTWILQWLENISFKECYHQVTE